MDKLLYDYYRSSCSYRVRIALNLKGISYKTIPVSLTKHQHHHPDYLKINPQGLVPIWTDEQIHLGQSLAIIEYLEEVYPTPPLLPRDVVLKAYTRQFSLIIACEIHPLNNLCVREYLKNQQWSEEKCLNWYQHWLKKGFDAYEALLQKLNFGEQFTLNQHLTMADLCLIPQVYNALRFQLDIDEYPKIKKIYHNCQTLEAFKKAYPAEQT